MAADVSTDCRNALSCCSHSKHAVSHKVKSIHRSSGGLPCCIVLRENTAVSQKILRSGIEKKLRAFV